ARVRNAVSLPIVAIGGINQENVAQVLRAGAQAVAVISAVLGPPDIEAAALGLVARMEKASG
ncbi:MAG TPA: thiamine phosphate synthase, partial [Dehalococcoidia bacterium]|nr:thiamine phosphate synthase [Dehalococcoidia bacterium]